MLVTLIHCRRRSFSFAPMLKNVLACSLSPRPAFRLLLLSSTEAGTLREGWCSRSGIEGQN